ncbi:MAG: hypothetical protein HRU38_25565, partial [Saccharospirillaceae bacterium]|nr:hypothetical protein [Pseudomonadales bacterium]NRB81983.1 hypothetical protein [Saccharospirillaceae bacterium]
MLYSPRKQKPISVKKQSGLATILVIIIIGMLLTTAMLAVVANNRSTQQKQVATHAQVHSQAGLWTGVELFRSYLKTLTPTARADLTDQTITLELADSESVYNIYDIEHTAKNETTNKSAFIKAKIKFYEGDAKSTSAVEVYFEIVPENCDEICERGLGDMNFYGDLRLDTALDFLAGSESVVNVDGDIIAGGYSISNLHSLNATGNIDLSSGGDSSYHFTFVKTNGTFTADRGSTATLEALGDINLEGTFKVEEKASSNGSITADSSPDTTSVLEARDFIHIFSGGFASAKSNTKVTTERDIKIVNIESLNSVDISKNEGLTSVKAYGEVECSGPVWINSTKTIKVNLNPSNVTSPIGGVLEVDSGCKRSGTTDVDLTDNDLIITPVAQIPRFVMIKPHVNVWDLKQFANYSFSYDKSINVTDVDGNDVLVDGNPVPFMARDRMRVDIQNIEGIADGLYYVRGNGSNQKFCKSLTDSGVCNSDDDFIKPCYGEGDTSVSTCFTATDVEGERVNWKVQGKNITPGIYFFEGDLTDNTEFSITTKLATGNYKAKLKFKAAMAPNYAGFKALCNNDYTDLPKTNWPT